MFELSALRIRCNCNGVLCNANLPSTTGRQGTAQGGPTDTITSGTQYAASEGSRRARPPRHSR